MSHGEDRLWGHALLYRHGHHNRRGGGGVHLGVHLLQMGGRPGTMFWGQHDVLLLQLLLQEEVTGCCWGRQGDLADLAALGVHPRLDWGKGGGKRGGELGRELGLVPSSPRLFLL